MYRQALTGLMWQRHRELLEADSEPLSAQLLMSLSGEQLSGEQLSVSLA